MSKSITGAEILDVGTWPASPGDMTISASILDTLISSFSGLGLSGRVPLKFGHNDGQPITDGQPALGWVSRLYRDGNKLLADFVDIPDVVFEAIRKGLYKFVSVELLKNVQAGTRVIPWVLDAVALLGADQPAVGTLKDLQALTLKRGPQLRASARVAFRRDTKLFSTGGQQAMTEDEVKALLKKQADELTAQFTAAMKAETVKIQAASDAQVAEAKAAALKATAESHRSLIKAKFEAAVKSEVLLPAKRESFYKFQKVDDDTVVTAIKLEDVDAYITEYSDKTKLSRKPTSEQGEDAKDEEGLRPDQVVAKRAEALCFSRKQDPKNYDHYKSAVAEVLRGDKDLGQKYVFMPDDMYRQSA